jgi:hypothetical protein
MFSQGELNKIFGPNTVFAVNPWHPRHVVSIAAVILALPSIPQGICGAQSKEKYTSWLTDRKIYFMALFNLVTSRPLLHLGNRFCSYYI